MQLDDVHSSHGETCTIHHAPNAAFQPDVVQVVLAGCHIPADVAKGVVPFLVVAKMIPALSV